MERGWIVLRLRRRIFEQGRGRSADGARTPGAQPRTGLAQRAAHRRRDARDAPRSRRAWRNAARRRPRRARPFSDAMHARFVAGTTASMVAELPAPGADTIPMLWASLAAPCTAIAFPLFVAGTLPPVLAAGGEGASSDSPWWRFKKIQDLVAIAPERLAPIAWKHFRPLEAAMLEQAPRSAARRASSTPQRAKNCSAASWPRISSAS